jgi:hypothetical protein
MVSFSGSRPRSQRPVGERPFPAARRGTPLFVPGDAEGARQLNDVEPCELRRRSRLERRLIAALSWDEEQDVETLAQRTGYKLGQLVLTALGLLADSGLAQRGRAAAGCSPRRRR